VPLEPVEHPHRHAVGDEDRRPPAGCDPRDREVTLEHAEVVAPRLAARALREGEIAGVAGVDRQQGRELAGLDVADDEPPCPEALYEFGARNG